MMGEQLTVEMVKADERMAGDMRLAFAGLIDRPKLPKRYIGTVRILPSRQKMLEVE